MSIDSRYKKEVDSFCSETYKVSGEEMLQMAKRNISIENTGTSRKARIAKRAVLIPIAAALFGMAAVSAAAGAAGYGPLSGLSEVFGKYFGDETTEKLAEEGYIYTAEDYAADSKAEPEKTDTKYAVMGESITSEGLTAKIIGVAGDTQSPQMLIDITVEDKNIAEKCDMLGVYALTLGAEEFDKNRENYLEEYGKAVKDDTIPNLYHASVRAAPAWVTSGKQVVVDIVCVHVMEDNDAGYHKYYREEEVRDHGLSPSEVLVYSDPSDVQELTEEDRLMNDLRGRNYCYKIKEYLPEMQFRFTIPENVFKEAAYMYYDELDLSYDIDGHNYHLCRGEFGPHESWITLDFGLPDGYPAEEFDGNYDNWLAAKTIAEKFTLTVDGKEYAPFKDKTGLYCDTAGDCERCIKDRVYLSINFPSVDFGSANSVTLTAKNGDGETASSLEIKNVSYPSEPAAEEETESAGNSWLNFVPEDTDKTADDKPEASAEEKTEEKEAAKEAKEANTNE